MWKTLSGDTAVLRSNSSEPPFDDGSSTRTRLGPRHHGEGERGQVPFCEPRRCGKDSGRMPRPAMAHDLRVVSIRGNEVSDRSPRVAVAGYQLGAAVSSFTVPKPSTTKERIRGWFPCSLSWSKSSQRDLQKRKKDRLRCDPIPGVNAEPANDFREDHQTRRLEAVAKAVSESSIDRETELAEVFPLQAVTSWIGNSQLIARSIICS